LRSVNLRRTAHYVLDLMEREEGRAVVPMALVTDLHPGKIPQRLHMDDLGGGEKAASRLRPGLRCLFDQASPELPFWGC
jgi:hypothetical protein